MQVVYTGTSAVDVFDASAEAAKDIAVFRGLGAGDSATGGAGADRIVLSGGGAIAGLGGGNDVFMATLKAQAGGSRDTIDGGAGTDLLNITLNSSQLTATVKAELALLTTYLSGDISQHFTSDIFNLDMVNVETVNLRVDGALLDLATVVPPVVTPPIPPLAITSAATASFAENGTGIAYEAAVTGGAPGAALSWSLSGADAALFAIDSSTGAIRFRHAPDYEAPTDAGHDNVYDITLTASDGTRAASKALAIRVTDVREGPAIIAPIALDAVAQGSGGFKIIGEAAGDQAGWSVSAAGDVNHDGYADLLVGAPGNAAAGDNAGAAYVVFGKAGGATVHLDAVAQGIGGFKITAAHAGDQAGWSVSAAGDVNHDGYADLLVGAMGSDAGSYAGAAYVVFGKADGMTVDLDAVARGTGGFKIVGEADGDNAGIAVSAAGDVNGDGLADLLVGANGNGAGGEAAGAAYVVFGKADGATIALDAVARGVGGFKIIGETDYDWGGYAVSAAGDVNHDGLADLLVGAPQNDAGGNAAGVAYVVFGKAGGEAVSLHDIALGSGGFRITGEAAEDQLGLSVSAAGDVNGDGYADLLVAAPFHGAGGAGAGSAYVVFGKAGGTAVDLHDVALGSGGFRITGEAASDQAGWSVSAAGDVNGDGLADLLVGAIGNGGGGYAGAAYLVFGKADGVAVDLGAVARGIGGFKILGQAEGDRAGSAVSAAGDINHDGFADLLVGAPGNDAGGNNAGAAYVIYGHADWIV